MNFRGGWVGLMALAALASPLLAQGPPPNQQHLRQMIEERFATQIQAELGLTDEQSARVRRVLIASAERRRQMENEERAAQRALRDQLRPGVAAQSDSVVRLLDRVTTLRINFAQSAKDEIRDLGAILTPVQQAQFLLLRDRLWARAQEVRMRRGPGGGQPGGSGPP